MDLSNESLESNITVVCATHPPVLHQNSEENEDSVNTRGVFNQVVVVSNENNKTRVRNCDLLRISQKLDLKDVRYIILMFSVLQINDSSDEENSGDILVINSPSPSNITFSQDTSHVSVITVGEEDTPLKVKDSRLEDYPPWDSTSSIGNECYLLV